MKILKLDVLLVDNYTEYISRLIIGPLIANEISITQKFSELQGKLHSFTKVKHSNESNEPTLNFDHFVRSSFHRCKISIRLVGNKNDLTFTRYIC